MAAPEVVIVHETVLASYLKDLGSFGCLVAVVGVGIWLDSVALQWVAAVLWIIWMLSKGLNLRSQRMTVPDARKRLDEIEAA
jgi:hypothetical protein